MILRSVVLPEPDGPTSAVTSPGASAKAMSARMSLRSPAALRKAFRLIETSTGPASPARCMSFKGLHHPCFDHQHDRDEAQTVGENAGDVE